MSPHITTISGKRINLLWPRPEDVEIGDIAHALSNICRYTGHVSEAFSVAQHSVIVSQSCPREFQLWGLLHDATEAYLGDVSSPLKSILEMYRVLESRHMVAICKRFGLDRQEPPIVKKIDKMLYAQEEKLLRNRIVEGIESLPVAFSPVSPGVAKAMFLARFDYLVQP